MTIGNGRTGLVAKKLGMTRIFKEDGTHVPVTVLHLDEVQVVDVRTEERDGYTALQRGVGSTISSRRRCVRISNCSRLFLSTCGERFTVKRSMCVGSGIGPRTRAPVRFAVLTISFVLLSSTR